VTPTASQQQPVLSGPLPLVDLNLADRVDLKSLMDIGARILIEREPLIFFPVAACFTGRARFTVVAKPDLASAQQIEDSLAVVQEVWNSIPSSDRRKLFAYWSDRISWMPRQRKPTTFVPLVLLVLGNTLPESAVCENNGADLILPAVLEDELPSRYPLLVARLFAEAYGFAIGNLRRLWWIYEKASRRNSHESDKRSRKRLKTFETKHRKTVDGFANGWARGARVP
jgi:hypothetical protein